MYVGIHPRISNGHDGKLTSVTHTGYKHPSIKICTRCVQLQTKGLRHSLPTQSRCLSKFELKTYTINKTYLVVSQSMFPVTSELMGFTFSALGRLNENINILTDPRLSIVKCIDFNVAMP